MKETNLIRALILTCKEYANDYYFYKNKYDTIASIVIELAMYIDQRKKFNCLMLDENVRKEYKQLCIRNLILALRQYLRNEEDIKFNSKISKLIENQQELILAEEELDIEINAEAICKIIDFFSYLTFGIEHIVIKFSDIVETHLSKYTDLHPELTTTISGIPVEVISTDIFKFLSLSDRLKFGLTSHQNFSLFNSEYQWKNGVLCEILNMDELNMIAKMCKGKENPYLFLTKQFAALKFSLIGFRKIAMDSLFNPPVSLYPISPFHHRFRGFHNETFEYPCSTHLHTLWRTVLGDFINAKENSSGEFFKMDENSLVIKSKECENTLKKLCDYTFKHIVIFNLYVKVNNIEIFRDNFLTPLHLATALELNWDEIFIHISSSLVAAKNELIKQFIPNYEDKPPSIRLE